MRLTATDRRFSVLPLAFVHPGTSELMLVGRYVADCDTEAGWLDVYDPDTRRDGPDMPKVRVEVPFEIVWSVEYKIVTRHFGHPLRTVAAGDKFTAEDFADVTCWDFETGHCQHATVEECRGGASP